MKLNRKEIITENRAVRELADDDLDQVTGGGYIPAHGAFSVGDTIPGGLGIPSPNGSVSVADKKTGIAQQKARKIDAINQAINTDLEQYCAGLQVPGNSIRDIVPNAALTALPANGSPT